MKKAKKEVETFVVVPLLKFQAMEQHQKIQAASPIEEPTDDSVRDSVSLPTEPADIGKESHEVSNSALSPTPPRAKNIAPRLRKNQLMKLLSGLEKEGHPEVVKLDNLEALCKNALSQTATKTLPNEEIFYSVLLKSQLAPFVRNRFKIKKYFKGRWFEI